MKKKGLTEQEEIELLELLEQEDRERARSSHLAFMDRCWMKSGDPFIKGFHTRQICDRIDQALKISVTVNQHI